MIGYVPATVSSSPTPGVNTEAHVLDDSGDSINTPKPKETTKKKHNGKVDPVLCSNIYDTAVKSNQALHIIQQIIPFTITVVLVFVVVIRC